MSDRKFPPPWTVQDNGACFIVRDANGQPLAYTYYEEHWDNQLNRSSSDTLSSFLAQHLKPSALAGALTRQLVPAQATPSVGTFLISFLNPIASARY
jgi:hypothetical protein